MSDNVNHPSHYETGKFECIDVMLETQGVEAVKAFCLCNAFKYIYRHNGKNGVEDIRKAKWYIDKYLELEDESAKELAHDMAGFTLNILHDLLHFDEECGMPKPIEEKKCINCAYWTEGTSGVNCEKCLCDSDKPNFKPRRVSR